MRSFFAAAALAMLLAGCAHQNVLLPAPGAALAPTGGARAVVTQKSVLLKLSGG